MDKTELELLVTVAHSDAEAHVLYSERTGYVNESIKTFVSRYLNCDVESYDDGFIARLFAQPSEYGVELLVKHLRVNTIDIGDNNDAISGFNRFMKVYPFGVPPLWCTYNANLQMRRHVLSFFYLVEQYSIDKEDGSYIGQLDECLSSLLPGGDSVEPSDHCMRVLGAIKAFGVSLSGGENGVLKKGIEYLVSMMTIVYVDTTTLDTLWKDKKSLLSPIDNRLVQCNRNLSVLNHDVLLGDIVRIFNKSLFDTVTALSTIKMNDDDLSDQYIGIIKEIGISVAIESLGRDHDIRPSTIHWLCDKYQFHLNETPNNMALLFIDMLIQVHTKTHQFRSCDATVHQYVDGSLGYSNTPDQLALNLLYLFMRHSPLDASKRRFAEKWKNTFSLLQKALGIDIDIDIGVVEDPVEELPNMEVEPVLMPSQPPRQIQPMPLQPRPEIIRPGITPVLVLVPSQPPRQIQPMPLQPRPEIIRPGITPVPVLVPSQPPQKPRPKPVQNQPRPKPVTNNPVQNRPQPKPVANKPVQNRPQPKPVSNEPIVSYKPPPRRKQSNPSSNNNNTRMDVEQPIDQLLVKIAKLENELKGGNKQVSLKWNDERSTLRLKDIEALSRAIKGSDYRLNDVILDLLILIVISTSDEAKMSHMCLISPGTTINGGADVLIPSCVFESNRLIMIPMCDKKPDSIQWSVLLVYNREALALKCNTKVALTIDDLYITYRTFVSSQRKIGEPLSWDLLNVNMRDPSMGSYLVMIVSSLLVEIHDNMRQDGSLTLVKCLSSLITKGAFSLEKCQHEVRRLVGHILMADRVIDEDRSVPNREPSRLIIPNKPLFVVAEKNSDDVDIKSILDKYTVYARDNEFIGFIDDAFVRFAILGIIKKYNIECVYRMYIKWYKGKQYNRPIDKEEADLQLIQIVIQMNVPQLSDTFFSVLKMARYGPKQRKDVLKNLSGALGYKLGPNVSRIRSIIEKHGEWPIARVILKIKADLGVDYFEVNMKDAENSISSTFGDEILGCYQLSAGTMRTLYFIRRETGYITTITSDGRRSLDVDRKLSSSLTIEAELNGDNIDYNKNNANHFFDAYDTSCYFIGGGSYGFVVLYQFTQEEGRTDTSLAIKYQVWDGHTDSLFGNNVMTRGQRERKLMIYIDDEWHTKEAYHAKERKMYHHVSLIDYAKSSFNLKTRVVDKFKNTASDMKFNDYKKRNPHFDLLMDTRRQDNVDIIVMDFVKNGTMAHFIRSNNTREFDPLNTGLCYHIIVQVAAYMHSLYVNLGITHNDISTNNVMIQRVKAPGIRFLSYNVPVDAVSKELKTIVIPHIDYVCKLIDWGMGVKKSEDGVVDVNPFLDVQNLLLCVIWSLLIERADPDYMDAKLDSIAYLRRYPTIVSVVLSVIRTKEEMKTDCKHIETSKSHIRIITLYETLLEALSDVEKNSSVDAEFLTKERRDEYTVLNLLPGENIYEMGDAEFIRKCIDEVYKTNAEWSPGCKIQSYHSDCYARLFRKFLDDSVVSVLDANFLMSTNANIHQIMRMNDYGPEKNRTVDNNDSGSDVGEIEEDDELEKKRAVLLAKKKEQEEKLRRLLKEQEDLRHLLQEEEEEEEEEDVDDDDDSL